MRAGLVVTLAAVLMAAVPTTAAAAAPADRPVVRAYATVAEDAPAQGRLTRIYDPSVGEDESWYVNDHTVVQDRATGTWHLYGITHAEPAAPLAEVHFAHATAPSLHGPWTKQPFALTADPAAGERYIWAPHVVEDAGLYYMFYAGGTGDFTSYRMHLATSTDLVHWTRSAANPLFTDGYEARDPMVVRHGASWVMYYTATTERTGGNHLVAYRTSTDLLHWSARSVAFTSPEVGTNGGPTESPFVFAHGGWYYLSVCCDGPNYDADYRRTALYRSRDPLHFDVSGRVATFDAHAAEYVTDTDGSLWVTHAGWGQGGVWLAPVTFRDQVVARGRTVRTPGVRMTVQTWPTTAITRLDLATTRSRTPLPTLDADHRGTGPYLAAGGFGVTDQAGPPRAVTVSADGRRITLSRLPFGDEPVTADWVLAVGERTVRTDLTWHVQGTTTAPVWELAFDVDAVPPRVGDPGGADRTGDASGFPAWTLATGPGISAVAAYRPGSAWRTDNHWFAPGGTSLVAWQSVWRPGGETLAPGTYAGGSWLLGASSTEHDTAFADRLAARLGGTAR